MIALVLFALLLQEPVERTPSIYRCPASEAESKFFAHLVEDCGFDTYCVEPKPGPSATQVAKGQGTFVKASVIDTKPNLRWRNATVDLVNGKISPKAWLEKTRGLGETVHFLSSPQTPGLRTATQTDSTRAVMAEMFVLATPGIPCLTADDVGRTRFLPGPGRLESWILAMNDWLGPMLYFRHAHPYMVTGKPEVIRADPTPGLFIFKQSDGKNSQTFYFNNADTFMELPPIDQNHLSIVIGLNVDEPKPRLRPKGFFIVEAGELTATLSVQTRPAR